MNRARFTKNCINRKIMPPHLYRIIKCTPNVDLKKFN